jgi:hypothetical protein
MNPILITAAAAFLIAVATLPFFLAAWLLIRRIEKNEHPHNDYDLEPFDDWWHDE